MARKPRKTIGGEAIAKPTEQAAPPQVDNDFLQAALEQAKAEEQAQDAAAEAKREEFIDAQPEEVKAVYRPKQMNSTINRTHLGMESGAAHRTLRPSETRDVLPADTRGRGGFYDLPDYNALLGQDMDRDFNQAPPAVTGPDGYPMKQRWVNIEMNDGAHAMKMFARGWRPRDPKTVPADFPAVLGDWQGAGCIMNGKTDVLMHIPHTYYEKRKQIKQKAGRDRALSFNSDEGDFMNMGREKRNYIQSEVVKNEETVTRGGREVSFAQE